MKNYNYIIEIPNTNNGIYVIMNIVEKRAYVGLAKNMKNRTLNHFEALCGVNKAGKKDSNRNIISEKNKQFLHFAIEQEKDTIDNGLLHNLESLYMYITKRMGFELYNIAKQGVTDEVIQSSDTLYQEKVKVLKDKFEFLTGKELEKVLSSDIIERKQIWDKIVSQYENKNNRDIICLSIDSYKEDVQEDKDKFQVIKKRLSSFALSKDILRDNLGIKWEEKSIFDEDLKHNSQVWVSNFGCHNGETPYEILLKMNMDKSISSDKCAYWALKKVNEENFRREYENDNSDVYIIFKSTTSDNSGGENETKKIDTIMSKSQIYENDKRIRQENKPDLMHSMYVYDKEKHTNVWKSLPRGLSYVTIPPKSIEERSGNKTVAFKISEFYLCKENFSATDYLRKENESPLSTYKVTFDSSMTENNSEIIVDGSNTECFIAKLEYPYVVQISNIPGLETYLRGWFNNEEKPRIVFHMSNNDDLTKNRTIQKAYAFVTELCNSEQKCVAYCLDDELAINTINDICCDSDRDLANVICKVGKKCTYEIQKNKGEEIIEIKSEEGFYDKMILDTDISNILNPKRLNGDNYKYYCIKDKEQDKVYSFRYSVSNVIHTDWPPFVFDEKEQ